MPEEARDNEYAAFIRFAVARSGILDELDWVVEAGLH